jgi:hypothetical protein
LCSNFEGWATSTTPHSTASDPAEVAAIEFLEQGTQKLEEGDVQGAKELYQRSVEIKRNASSLFNLGVTHYHLSMFSSLVILLLTYSLLFVTRGVRRSNCGVEGVHQPSAYKS